ncbi:MAG: Hpt domain-containing protein [Desulfovibrio sp.]|nr:Hpt domain-containing protein [Desulfovibrio sp.]
MVKPEGGLIDLGKTLEGFEDDQELLREVLSVFVSESPQRHAAIADAFAARDVERLAQLAHSLKGVCGTIRAEPLREMSYRVELAARNRDEGEIERDIPVLLAMLAELTEYLSGELRDGLGGT